MLDPEALDRMTEACLAAHDAVMAHGSSEMQLAAHLLLMALGKLIASDGTNDNRPETDMHDPTA